MGRKRTARRGRAVLREPANDAPATNFPAGARPRRADRPGQSKNVRTRASSRRFHVTSFVRTPFPKPEPRTSGWRKTRASTRTLVGGGRKSAHSLRLPPESKAATMRALLLLLALSAQASLYCDHACGGLSCEYYSARTCEAVESVGCACAGCDCPRSLAGTNSSNATDDDAAAAFSPFPDTCAPEFAEMPSDVGENDVRIKGVYEFPGIEAAAWLFHGDASRRRRGCRADVLRRTRRSRPSRAPQARASAAGRPARPRSTRRTSGTSSTIGASGPPRSPAPPRASSRPRCSGAARAEKTRCSRHCGGADVESATRPRRRRRGPRGSSRRRPRLSGIAAPPRPP